MCNKNKTFGFSLVELSVTLVIAGLVMAAITGGSHMLQAAKLNKVMAEIGGYVKAVNNFRDKYKAWPGDMPNATSFWGTYAAGPPITGVTNGNGNEQIVDSAITEILQAIRMLSLSGLIAGDYSGADAGTPDFQGGVNVPASSIVGAYYFPFYHVSHYSTTGNTITFSSTNAGTDSWGGALSPADARVIDTKMDDGLASTGNFYALRATPYIGVAGKCVDADAAAASANYILTDTTVSCRLFYWLNKV